MRLFFISLLSVGSFFLQSHVIFSDTKFSTHDLDQGSKSNKREKVEERPGGGTTGESNEDFISRRNHGVRGDSEFELDKKGGTKACQAEAVPSRLLPPTLRAQRLIRHGTRHMSGVFFRCCGFRRRREFIVLSSVADRLARSAAIAAA